MTVTVEYLNPIEVFAGRWLFTLHRETIQFTSGDVIVFETILSNVIANQGIDDSLFALPSD